MDKPKIAFNLKPNNYDGIRTLASAVLIRMNLNPNFINPQPTLAVIQTADDEMWAAMTKWGTVGHRGSHVDFVNLKVSTTKLYGLLKLLAAWVTSTIDPDLSYVDQEAILLSSGFWLRKQRTPQGFLGAVQDLHRFIARNLSDQQVKLVWDYPLGVATGTNIKNYKIFRSNEQEFRNAIEINTCVHTTYIDTPGPGLWYYWVVPCNTKGDGVESEMCEVGVPPVGMGEIKKQTHKGVS